jgi:hypothetical protein
MSSLNQIPFLSGYMTMDAANRGREGQQMQQAQQFMTLQGAMEDRGAKRTALDRDATFRARLAGATTDEQRAQIAMEAAGPTGVLNHLDRAAKNRATDEQARTRIVMQATQFAAVRQQEQQRIDRMTNKDDREAAQQILNNQARAYELQLKGEAARLQGAIGADTVMGFRPRPVPVAPTMQTQPAAPARAAPTEFGTASNEASAVGAINAGGGAPMSFQVMSPTPPAAIQNPAPAAAPAPTSAPRPPLTIAPLTRAQGGLAPDVPTPGQGVPGVRAQQAMPQFFGSPREVRKLQNDWMEDQAKAAQKQADKDGKIGINIAGGRESVFINRVVNSGNQAVADLENVVKLPMSAGRGIFGGRSQGKSLMEASKESLTNSMTTQEVQTYNVVATGFQRALAAIEGMGLAPTNALMHQMDAVIFKEGDTGLTKLTKLAQIRQIVEKGLETVVTNQRVDAETKKLAQTIMDKAIKAVPFTPGEVIELQVLQNTNPNATLKDVMASAKAQQTAPGWDSEKERRYQKLKAKQGK